jgi:UDP-N-acetylmuramyl pentapeptide phosphotransferase/UDP-N-acetylglucosamine-1-phosphate transferase
LTLGRSVWNNGQATRAGRRTAAVEGTGHLAMEALRVLGGVAAAVYSLLICTSLVVILRPLLRRYAQARPNARSSHLEPTPQGGGIAVVGATLAATWLGTLGSGTAADALPVPVVAAVIAVTGIGAVDDIRPLPVAPRLVLQTLAVAAVIYALPHELRPLSFLPWWLDRLVLLVGGLWFINLVNFMDGIDWMTVAEVVPITATLAIIGYLGVPAAGGVVVTAAALCGAMLAFAYFNRPVATLFLGDVGSLPVGLLLGWLLVFVAGTGELAAAVLLPLYYLADATLTLLRRLLRGERVWEAHRSHFYQRATDHGFTVTGVVARVFAVNLLLAALAVVTVIARHHAHSRGIDVAALVLGAAFVGWLLYVFARGPTRSDTGRNSEHRMSGLIRKTGKWP